MKVTPKQIVKLVVVLFLAFVAGLLIGGYETRMRLDELEQQLQVDKDSVEKCQLKLAKIRMILGSVLEEE